MSITSATFRVIPPSPEARPDREHLEEAAKALKDLGFDIVRIGRFGVSVNADHQHFQNVLGVTVPASGALVQELDDPPDALKGLVDRLEVVPAPTYYASKAS